MPAKPWVTFRPPDLDREYLALLTELPLARFRDLGRFLLYTRRIEAQLRKTPGVIGYSLMARVFSKRFWTLSVWQDDASLAKFVVQIPHAQVMSALAGKMKQTRFVRWPIRGSEYPLRWNEAFQKKDASAQAKT
jgi:quinol monooxygenase YgiN